MYLTAFQRYRLTRHDTQTDVVEHNQSVQSSHCAIEVRILSKRIIVIQNHHRITRTREHRNRRIVINTLNPDRIDHHPPSVDTNIAHLNPKRNCRIRVLETNHSIDPLRTAIEIRRAVGGGEYLLIHITYFLMISTGNGERNVRRCTTVRNPRHPNVVNTSIKPLDYPSTCGANTVRRCQTLRIFMPASPVVRHRNQHARFFKPIVSIIQD